MHRIVLWLALVPALAGCDAARTAMTPKAEKVNTAFPLPYAVVVAENALFTALGESPTGMAARERYRQLLLARGLACGESASVGRLDTPADIRARLTDIRCFGVHDENIADWLGVRRLALALQAPPSAPPTALAGRIVLAPTADQDVVAIAVAERANAVVLRGSRGSFTTMHLPSGRKLVTLDSPEQPDEPGQLSPNGRVLAVPAGTAGLRMVNAENGDLLWTSRRHAQVLAWLPEVEAVLLAQADGAAAMLDARAGAVAPYAAGVDRPAWALPLPGAAAGKTLLALGNRQSVALVEHSRGADGALATGAPRPWRLDGPGLTDGRPIAMAQGHKLVYRSGRDLAWLDTQSGGQGSWPLGDAQARGFAKISEKQLYVEMGLAPGKRSGRLFNIDDASFTAVQGGEAAGGPLLALAPRTGYARAVDNTLVLEAAAVPEGAAQPLEQFLAQANLAAQMAKLEPGRAEAAGSQVRGTATGAVVPALSAVPRNARIAIVSVHGPTARHAAHLGADFPGAVRIDILPSKTPLVLVLASHEPVTWDLENPDRKLAAVLVSGQGRPVIANLKATSVVRIGEVHAYKPEGPEMDQLKALVRQHLPNTFGRVHTAYKGQQFVIPAD